MAIKYLNDGFLPLLKKGVGGVLVYQVGTDEAQVITASANGGNFAAVNAGTVAAKLTGADSAVLYKLTINAADAAAVGPVCFQSKGATDTTYVWARIVDELSGMIAVSGIPVGAFVNDSITAAAIATDAIGALELAATAVAEIVSAILLSLKANVRENVVDVLQSSVTVIPVKVHTHEAKVVTVSKNGGAFGATAGSVAAQVTGTDYKLTTHATDVATLGIATFKLTGATSEELVEVRVVEDDPTQPADAVVTKANISRLRNPILDCIEVQQGVASVIPFRVAVQEAKTVTVSKNGGAFGATAGSVVAQINGDDYKLTLHITDVDTLGLVSFRLTGATSTEAINLRVVSSDPTLNALGDTTGRVDLTTDALDGDALAADALDASGLKADAATEIAGSLAATLVNLQANMDLRKTTPT